jgi:5'/3'-nucleotidase SurE
VIAPDGNRSAMARSITTRRPLWVTEVPFEDGSVGYATDGTPVDCVRLANLGLIEGFQADLVVAGINHGANLGDDITYSGTVAAALEGLVLGVPGIAVSQQSRERRARLLRRRQLRLRARRELRGAPGRRRWSTRRCRRPRCLNINVPGYPRPAWR